MTKSTLPTGEGEPTPDPHFGLLPGLRLGDPAVQSIFFGNVGPRALKILVGLFHQKLSRQDCEDVLIEAGVKFFRSVSRFDPARGAKLETWFRTIAINAGRDEWRRRFRAKRKAQAPEWRYASATPELEAFFQRALGRLTEAEREYLMLWRFGRGLPPEEIAEALKLTPGAARKRKHGLLRKLEALLGSQPELSTFLAGVVSAGKSSSVVSETEADGKEHESEA
jgi:RNA polymerase sigma factor (sigma-70 family)